METSSINIPPSPKSSSGATRATNGNNGNGVERPGPTVVLRFDVMELGSRLFVGAYCWATVATQDGQFAAVIHNMLTRYQAEELARALNRTLEGMREVIGLSERAMAKQLAMDFRPRIEKRRAKPLIHANGEKSETRKTES